MELSSSASAGLAADLAPRKSTKKQPQSLPAVFLSLAAVAAKVALGYFALLALLVLIHFPYQVDEAAPQKAPKSNQNYYADVYGGEKQPAATPEATMTEAETKYVRMAREAIENERIGPKVAAFVSQYGLAENKRVLDVGAGTGYLQDHVKNYVGLDISPTARRYFHKPFVEASATDMPFRDNEFDAAWSIWVLEHVPKPEQALNEIRRVVKDGGLVFLKPAWACPWWFADGYQVRPYSDFGAAGKIRKASLNVLASPYYRGASLIPTRYVRKWQAQWSGKPTRFHYTLLEPNYKDYWVADSDAINNLDYYETLLWFTSRGDECLNCEADPLWDANEIILRIHKPASH